MKQKFATIFLLFLCCFKTAAQFNETIRTARPGQAIGSFTTGKGIFQVQSGFDYFSSNSNSATGSDTEGFLNNTVLRYGLTELFELSALGEYRTGNARQNGVTSSVEGLSAFDVGFRYHIFTGKELIPNVGFQFRMRLPILGKPYEITDAAPRFILALSQHLSKKFTLITNWGGSWNGNNSAPSWNYVVNLSFPFNEHFGAFVETYGNLLHGVLSSNLDTGIAWLLTNDLQLDLYGGFGSNAVVKEYFVSSGVSWRTKRSQ